MGYGLEKWMNSGGAKESVKEGGDSLNDLGASTIEVCGDDEEDSGGVEVIDSIRYSIFPGSREVCIGTLFDDKPIDRK